MCERFRTLPDPAWLPERFRLLSKLGAGGMGEVWLADDLLRGREVAMAAFSVADQT